MLAEEKRHRNKAALVREYLLKHGISGTIQEVHDEILVEVPEEHREAIIKILTQ
jgi:DNA polymerase I-like protein with 3'-5' exonuclease and polymerase domains